jgi:transposase
VVGRNSPEGTGARPFFRDDFALRKGSRYGTILVDLERRRVVDLLPDREAATVAGWLRARPGVEFVSRDRAGTYAQAASEAAPGAVQVADRWHLLKNARDAAERILQRRSASVRALLGGRPEDRAVGTPMPAVTASPGRIREEAREAKWRQRRERFEEVRRRHRGGASLRGIARALGMNYQTVERYVRSQTCPDWQPGRRRPSLLDRFEGHIRRRIAEGCGNARQLLRELHAMGYRGGKTVVQQRVRRLKAEGGHPPAPEPETAVSGRPDIPSFSRLAVTIVRRPTDQEEEDQRALAALCSGDGLIREATDEAAVRSGVTLDWSNGPVEGHVNRLKVIKRSMYGRARFDLLRARVLASA